MSGAFGRQNHPLSHRVTNRNRFTDVTPILAMLHRRYMYKILSPTYQSDTTTLPSRCPFPVALTHWLWHSRCRCKNWRSLSLTFLSLLLSLLELELPPTNLMAPTEPKSGFLVHPSTPVNSPSLSNSSLLPPTHAVLQQVSKPLARNPSSSSHQPKGPKEQYQRQWVQLSVGGLLGVFWDSKDQETSYTVTPCWAPCGWYRVFPL